MGELLSWVCDINAQSCRIRRRVPGARRGPGPKCRPLRIQDFSLKQARILDSVLSRIFGFQDFCLGFRDKTVKVLCRVLRDVWAAHQCDS